MKQSFKLKRAASLFSILTIILSNAAPVLANTQSSSDETVRNDENTQIYSETPTEITETEESVVVPSEPEQPENSDDENNTANESQEPVIPEESTEESESSEESTESSESPDETEESESTTESEEPEESTDESEEQPNITDEKQPQDNKDEKPKEKPVVNGQQPATSTQTTPSTTSMATEPKQPQSAIIGPVFSGVGNSLDSRLLVNGVTSSDLNGYELPLFNRLKDSRSAALIMESLAHLTASYAKEGQGPDRFDNLHFPIYIYEQVFGITIGKNYDELSQAGKKVEVDQAVPGDLLLWKKDGNYSQVGIYLGQNKFILADEELLQKNQTKEKKEAIGVRILSFDSQQEDEADNKDKWLTIGYEETPDAIVHLFDDLQLTTHGQELVKGYAASFNFTENPLTRRFVDTIGESARELGLKYDVFASVMIAQAILESGSGTSGLSTSPYFNLFGIKGSYQGASVNLATQEDNGSGQLYGIQAAFRAYPSYKESLEDYTSLIRNGISGNSNFYKDTWRSESKNYLQATASLTGKYATDTFYNNKLNSIIAAYNLTQYDEPKTDETLSLGDLENVPAFYRSKIKFPKYNGVNYNSSGSYGSDQCTWYVYNRVSQLGGVVDDYMGNGADWATTGNRLGYVTSSTPKAGDVISFKQGVAGYHELYGHVGFVEAVGPEGILISEGDASYLNYKVIPNSIALSNGVSYVEPK